MNKDLKRAVSDAAVQYDLQIGQLYDDLIGDLAARYSVDEDVVEDLWMEVAP